MAADDHDPLASEIMVPSTDPEKKEETKKVNGEFKGKGKEESDVPDIVSVQHVSRARCMARFGREEG